MKNYAQPLTKLRLLRIYRYNVFVITGVAWLYSEIFISRHTRERGYPKSFSQLLSRLGQLLAFLLLLLRY